MPQFEGLASLREQRFRIEDVSTTPPLPRARGLLVAGFLARIWQKRTRKSLFLMENPDHLLQASGRLDHEGQQESPRARMH